MLVFDLFLIFPIKIFCKQHNMSAYLDAYKFKLKRKEFDSKFKC